MSGPSPDSPAGKVSPFNPGAVGAGAADQTATTTRFWWVRHAPVEHGGRIYGQKDMPCDCTDTASRGSWRARPLKTAQAIVRAGLPGPDRIPGPEAPAIP